MKGYGSSKQSTMKSLHNNKCFNIRKRTRERPKTNLIDRVNKDEPGWSKIGRGVEEEFMRSHILIQVYISISFYT